MSLLPRRRDTNQSYLTDSRRSTRRHTRGIDESGLTSQSSTRTSTADVSQTWPLITAVLLGSCVLVAAGLFVVHVRLERVDAGYRIHRATKEREELRQELRRFEIEVVTLSHRTRVTRFAREELGMVEESPLYTCRAPTSMTGAP